MLRELTRCVGEIDAEICGQWTHTRGFWGSKNRALLAEQRTDGELILIVNNRIPLLCSSESFFLSAAKARKEEKENSTLTICQVSVLFSFAVNCRARARNHNRESCKNSCQQTLVCSSNFSRKRFTLFCF